MLKSNGQSAKLRWLQGSVAVILVLSAQLFAAQIDGPTPPDSFLVHQVSSVKELVAEITNHPFIRNRYARLYHVPGGKVEQFISRNLILSTLKHDYTHIVYCVTPGGVVFTCLETQHAGDQVFAMRNNGNPILRWACGNPFTSSLPQPPGMVVFTGNNHRHPKAGLKNVASTSNVFTGTENAPLPHDANTIVTEKVSSYLGALPSTGTVTNIIEPTVASASKIFPLLPFTPLIPVTTILASNTSSSTSGGGTTTTSTGGTSSGTSSGTTAGTTSGTTAGTTSGSSTGGTTGTSGSVTTNGTTSGSTSGTSAGTTTTGGPSITPEPNSITIWTLAGIFLAIGAAAGKRKNVRSRTV